MQRAVRSFVLTSFSHISYRGSRNLLQQQGGAVSSSSSSLLHSHSSPRYAFARFVIRSSHVSSDTDHGDNLLQNALNGNLDSIAEIGRQYLDGELEDATKQEARRWLETAAELGHVESKFLLGMLLVTKKSSDAIVEAEPISTGSAETRAAAVLKEIREATKAARKARKERLMSKSKKQLQQQKQQQQQQQWQQYRLDSALAVPAIRPRQRRGLPPPPAQTLLTVPAASDTGECIWVDRGGGRCVLCGTV